MSSDLPWVRHVPSRSLQCTPSVTALTAGASTPNDVLHAYCGERAMGGAGLIVDGHMAVMVEGMMAPHYIRAWETDWIPA